MLGCLVVANYGARRDLHMLVGPDSELREAGAEPPAQGGSIMIVLATDAPLSERQLRRLAQGVRPRPRGLVRHQRERRVRDRLLDRPARSAPRARPDEFAFCETTRRRFAISSRPPARSFTNRS